MMIKKGVLFLGFVLLYLVVNAQSERKFVRRGNDDFENRNFTESEIKYRKAIEEKSDFNDALYALGDALYKQEKYEDAAQQFQAIAGKSDVSKNMKAKAYHNLGNSLLKSKKLKESIEAYKNALKLNPGDIETKHNLTYAMNQLRKQQNRKKNQKDQQKQNKQNKDQQNKENKKKDQKKNDQNQNQQKQDQNKKQDQEKKKQQQNQQPQKKKQEISKKDAQRLLQALENDEKQLQKKLKKKKAKSKNVKVTKNW